MDAAAVVTLLALLVAMAGVSQALHIQGGLDKNEIPPGSSEEIVADRLLGLVSQHATRTLDLWEFSIYPSHLSSLLDATSYESICPE